MDQDNEENISSESKKELDLLDLVSTVSESTKLAALKNSIEIESTSYSLITDKGFG